MARHQHGGFGRHSAPGPEGGAHLGGRGVAVLFLALGGFAHDGGQPFVEGGAQLFHSGEGGAHSREHFGQGSADRVNVGTGLGLAFQLFVGAVAEGAYRGLHGRNRRGRAGQAEIHQHKAAAGPVANQVGRLDVAVQ
ncbi:hypothetical protein ABS71_19680 [bacterium SCN 62-11]|nr:MAG: hypothetical protein ABS71_19680 [bacterium SCN 62-11]